MRARHGYRSHGVNGAHLPLLEDIHGAALVTKKGMDVV